MTFDSLFMEWLSVQPSKRWFCHCAGIEEEIAFIAEHADCECTKSDHNGSPADTSSNA